MMTISRCEECNGSSMLRGQTDVTLTFRQLSLYCPCCHENKSRERTMWFCSVPCMQKMFAKDPTFMSQVVSEIDDRIKNDRENLERDLQIVRTTKADQ